MTAQIHEILYINGKRESMNFCPPLPEQHPRIVINDRDSFIFFSTACWRRYRGTWEIKEDKFYLKKLEGYLRLEGDEPLFADWFTGVIRIPKGKIIYYINMGFASVYEEEMHMEIEKGIIKDVWIIKNDSSGINPVERKYSNFPGDENRFPGDDEM